MLYESSILLKLLLSKYTPRTRLLPLSIHLRISYTITYPVPMHISSMG